MVLRVARWWLTLLGGVLLGMGLVLHGQFMVVGYMRDEVASTFVLWRAIGKLTFAFQDSTTQAALTAHDFPMGLILEADRAAWTLVAIGVILATTAFLIRRPQRQIRTG
ncbi:MAG: hypothetical protein V3U11_06295 [Planctomycetota bacterium]